MRKTIGNISFILALVCVLFLIFGDLEHEQFRIIAPLYGIFMCGGIILRIGDFFKWRGKMTAQGMNEAKKENATHFCPHCGKGLTNTTAFCPHCGNKLDQ